MTYDNFSYVPDDSRCSVTAKLRPGKMTVRPLPPVPTTGETKSQVQFMFSAGYDPSPYSISGVQLCAFCPIYRKKLVKVAVILQVGLTWEDLTLTCPGTAPGLLANEAFWLDSWWFIHPVTDSFNFFPNWELVVTQDVLAQKKSIEIVQSNARAVIETTMMKLSRIPN